jgi:hypothetical protein
MDPFRILSQYFWLIFLGMSLFNYLAAQRQLQQSGAFSGSDAHSASLHVRWFALAGALPWVVMGLGQIMGFTPTVWYYFRPQDRNPFVVGWLACIFFLAVVYAIWVFYFDGARKVREYGLMAAVGMRGKRAQPSWLVKLLAALGPLFVLGWICLASSMNASLPR